MNGLVNIFKTAWNYFLHFAIKANDLDPLPPADGPDGNLSKLHLEYHFAGERSETQFIVRQHTSGLTFPTLVIDFNNEKTLVLGVLEADELNKWNGDFF